MGGKVTKVLFLTLLYLLNSSWDVNAKVLDFSSEIGKLESSLKEFKLIEAREILVEIQTSELTSEQWFIARDLIHKYPQIGLDALLNFDKSSNSRLTKVDKAIELADKNMLSKNFSEAAKGYELVLRFITKDQKFKNGRNYQLYWSLVHSLARSLYALKQYNDAFLVYRSIPSSYPFYKQVQFELMWNNYMNERLEYSLGSIATMASGHFSNMLEPEVYLLQYYMYRRMCRDKEVDLIKTKVKYFNEHFTKYKIPFKDWIKKDIETLVYKQILDSGDPKNIEVVKLRTTLNKRLTIDSKRLQKEFALVAAHLDVDSGKNKKLKPVNNFDLEQLMSSSFEKWAVDDNEIWSDELGKQVFIQKDLCAK